jgi:hypothetical protein
VNALTYTARLYQHDAGVRSIDERTNLSRKEGDRSRQVILFWLVTRAVLVGAVTAIGTIFLDWDAEKAQGDATGLAIVFSWAACRCSGGRHGIALRLGTIGE